MFLYFVSGGQRFISLFQFLCFNVTILELLIPHLYLYIWYNLATNLGYFLFSIVM